MRFRLRAFIACQVIAACSGSSSAPPKKGRIVVAITIDWEGAYLSPEGLDALDEFRHGLEAVPLTHYVSAAYFTKPVPDPTTLATITEAVRPGDELALHLHGWKSLAVASSVEPKLSPSFLTGTDKLLEFEDGDIGFDTDLDAYTGPELRALIRTSRRLIEQTRLPVSKTFRAGGYLGTPKVLQALRDEGYTVDSSATDYRQLDERKDEILPKRIAAIWPNVDTGTQPWLVPVRGGQLLEMPIAAFADYATAAEVTGILEAAHARLKADPRRDVFVVLGFHQETGAEFVGRLREAIDRLLKRRDLAEHLLFTTVEHAAALANAGVAPVPT